MTDDYPQDRSTPGVLRVGASTTGNIETRGDADWFKVRLQAGKTYRIDLEGAPSRSGTLTDPELLGVHDYRGLLAPPDRHSDDGGAGYNSRMFFTADRYGEYYIAAGAGSNRTGTYKLLVEEVRADDYPDGGHGALDVGAPIRGEIELPVDRDGFKVWLEAGRTYRIEIDGGPVAARRFGALLYDLSDAQGNPVRNVIRDGGDRLFFRPGEDGVYTLEVGGVGNNARDTGMYELSVRDVTRADDYRTGAGGAVPVGGTAAGELEKPGDEDWFAVTLEAGAWYRVDVRGAASGQGALADPVLHGIYRDNGDGAPGARIPDSGDNDSGPGRDSLVLFRAPEAGTYHLFLGAYQQGAGSYTVSVTEAPEQHADTGTHGTVQVGGRVTGALENSADEDWFAVDLEAGIEYRIEVRGNTASAWGGSLYNPALSVYDAQGETLHTAVAGDGSGKLGHNAALAFTAYEDGVHYIGIDGGGRTGTYTVFVNRLTDEYGTTILTDAGVTVGGSATGDIGRPRDRDWFAVELEAGRAYRIELEGAPTDRGTLTDPYLRGVYFDRALLPGTADDDGGEGLNSRVDMLAPETGTYYISAGAYSARTGSYRLSVREVADDYPATAATGAVVEVGGSAAGAVNYGTDVDWFAVSLEAGRWYRVDLEGTSTGRGSLEDPVLRGIYSADGHPVGDAGADDDDGVPVDGTAAADDDGVPADAAGGDDDGGEGYNSRLEFTVPETAIYYIAAGAHATHTGTYLLSVEEVADDYPASPATGAVVAVGGSSTGEIERPGDADWFLVELDEGREYQIDLEGWRTDGGTLEDPYLLGIHDLDGELIPGTGNDDGGEGLNSRLAFEAPYTGVYYIAAGAYEDYTGDYTLGIVEVL